MLVMTTKHFRRAVWLRELTNATVLKFLVYVFTDLHCQSFYCQFVIVIKFLLSHFKLLFLSFCSDFHRAISLRNNILPVSFCDRGVCDNFHGIWFRRTSYSIPHLFACCIIRNTGVSFSSPSSFIEKCFFVFSFSEKFKI